MATNKELERMINNVEKEIGKLMFSIQMLDKPFDGIMTDRDPDTGLSKTYMKLKNKHSLLIKISTKLQKQHCDNQLNERKMTKEKSLKSFGGEIPIGIKQQTKGE